MLLNHAIFTELPYLHDYDSVVQILRSPEGACHISALDGELFLVLVRDHLEEPLAPIIREVRQ